MKVTTLTRSFLYDGNTLTDPDTLMSPELVMQHYSGTYPELTNGHFTSKEDDGKTVYEFHAKIKTKG